ncbi:MAG: type III polyketide synthase [Bacteriovorax sp.]
MAKIVAVQTSFPEHRTSQKNIQGLLGDMWPDKKNYVKQFGESATVMYRDLAFPLNDYQALGDIGNRNNMWMKVALNLQEKNLSKLFDKTKVDVESISQIVSTSVTGLSIPTIEAKLMNKFKFSENTKRVPIFGLGCLGGVAGINRLNDYLKFRPQEAGLLLATEICTLTFQFHDRSVANLVGTSLFGDGAAALLMVGDDHPLAKDAQFEIIDGDSFFYPDTERIMGWDVIGSGFQIVLSGDVPNIVTTKVSKNLSDFLQKSNTTLDDIHFMVSHPGGPKVLDALVEVTKKTKEHFQFSWDSLREHGNMSSVSVLNVMEQTIEKTKIEKGSLGMMIAMGPAFCSELALIKKV